MRNKVFRILICCGLLIGITGCGKESNKVNSKEQEKIIITNDAEFLNWKEIYSVVKDNQNESEKYNDKWFIYTGYKQKSTDDTLCSTFSPTGLCEYGISIEFRNGEKLNIKDKDGITVVGKFSSINGDLFTLKDAFVIPESFYGDDNYIKAIIKYDDTYYEDYEFDKNSGLITKYTEVVYGSNSSGGYPAAQKNKYEYYHTLEYNGDLLIKDSDTYSQFNGYYGETTSNEPAKTIEYKYDENKKVINKTETTHFNNDSIDDSSFEYKLNNKNQIESVVEIRKSIFSDHEYTNTYQVTYEYNDKNQVVKETTKYSGGSYFYEYSYDDYGNKIEEKYSNGSSKFYTYGIIGRKEK